MARSSPPSIASSTSRRSRSAPRARAGLTRTRARTRRLRRIAPRGASSGRSHRRRCCRPAVDHDESVERGHPHGRVDRAAPRRPRRVTRPRQGARSRRAAARRHARAARPRGALAQAWLRPWQRRSSRSRERLAPLVGAPRTSRPSAGSAGMERGVEARDLGQVRAQAGAASRRRASAGGLCRGASVGPARWIARDDVVVEDAPAR